MLYIPKTLQELILSGDKTIEDAVKGSKYQSQAEALLLLLSGENVFLSGDAGAGKSRVISTYADLIQRIRPGTSVYKTSTTGISAVAIDGITIHSYSGLGVSKLSLEERLNSGQVIYPKTKKFIKDTDILIIDEVSMLSEFSLQYVLDVIQHVAKRNWKDIQFIFSGDFCQLPPVSRRGEAPEFGNFCYGTPAWEEIGLKDIYLDRLYRTADKELAEILTNISLGNIDDVNLDQLKVVRNLDGINSVCLCSTNREADEINRRKQRENPRPVIIEADPVYSVFADKTESKKYAKDMNMDKTLVLKEGDLVSITTNNNAMNDYSYPLKETSPPLQNGMIGTIEKDGIDSFKFWFEDPKTGEELGYVIHSKATFTLKEKVVDLENETVEEVTKAEFSQFPFRLAYAVSIHKSQGQTYSNVALDLQNCWQENLGYVSLSRAQTSDGIVLLQKNPNNPPYDNLSKVISPESLKIKKQVLANAKQLREDSLEELVWLFDNADDEIYKRVEKRFGGSTIKYEKAIQGVLEADRKVREDDSPNFSLYDDNIEEFEENLGLKDDEQERKPKDTKKTSAKPYPIYTRANDIDNIVILHTIEDVYGSDKFRLVLLLEELADKVLLDEISLEELDAFLQHGGCVVAEPPVEPPVKTEDKTESASFEETESVSLEKSSFSFMEYLGL